MVKRQINVHEQKISVPLERAASEGKVNRRSTADRNPANTRDNADQHKEDQRIYSNHRHHYKYFAQCCHQGSLEPIPDEQRHLSRVHAHDRDDRNIELVHEDVVRQIQEVTDRMESCRHGSEVTMVMNAF